jgi:hypothetical protein
MVKNGAVDTSYEMVVSVLSCLTESAKEGHAEECRGNDADNCQLCADLLSAQDILDAIPDPA